MGLRFKVRSFVPPVLRRYVDRKLDGRVRLRTAMRGVGEDARAQDVYIVSFPKSGSTWVQHLVAGLVYGMDPRFAPDALVHAVVPDVHEAEYFRRYGTPTYFKSHHLPRPEYRRVVYVLRDGRDAMVSYFHHLRALHGEAAVDFMRLVESGERVIPCKWHAHVDAWAANPHGAEVLTLRYEALVADPVAEVRRLCAFAGVERDDAFLERVAGGASFANMAAKERAMGWNNRDWPADRPFVRRGKVGSYLDEMPADVLAAFEREAGAALERCGYVMGVETAGG